MNDVTVPTLQMLPPADGVARAAVLLLHGLDMAPQTLAPFVRTLRLPAWVALSAAPLARPGGGRAWWPVDDAARALRLASGPSDFAAMDPPGRAAARACVREALAALRARAGPGVPLAVAGFSQGAMLALDALLVDDDVAGEGAVAGDGERPAACGVDALMLWSASRLAYDRWAPHLSRLRGMPVQQLHGRRDANLGLAAGESLRDALVAAGARMEWVAFDGGHEIPLAAWVGLRRWVREAGEGAGGAAAGAR